MQTNTKILILTAVLAIMTTTSDGCQEWFKWLDFDQAWGYGRVGCGLTEIPTDIPVETNGVSLGENDITSLKANSFQTLVECEYLGFEQNPISDIAAGAFHGLVKLKEINLDDCQLTEIRADMWEGLGSTTFTRLSLQKNKIRTLSAGPFQGLSKLWKLDMSGNELTEIRPDMFEGIEGISYLVLSGNQIATITPGAFTSLYQPSEININKNALTTLKRDIFAPGENDAFKGKVLLKVMGNPMECDADMCWLKEAEEKDWVMFLYWDYYQTAPECVNYPDVDWREIDLGCEE